MAKCRRTNRVSMSTAHLLPSHRILFGRFSQRSGCNPSPYFSPQRATFASAMRRPLLILISGNLQPEVEPSAIHGHASTNVLFKCVHSLYSGAVHQCQIRIHIYIHMMNLTGIQSLIMLSSCIFDLQWCVCIRYLARSFLVTIPMTCKRERAQM